MKPINYNNLTWGERRRIRQEYAKEQNNLCHFCRKPLDEYVPWVKPINQELFPPNFFNHPVHLHHDHKTGMTIGAVHAYCNAVLWQFHGE